MSASITERIYANLEAQEIAFCVALAILIFDYFFTFDLEVEFVWKKRNAINSTLLLNRYIPFVAFTILALPVSSPHICRMLTLYQGIITIIMVATSEVMLILRVYAVNLRSSLVAGILLTVWLGQIVLMGYALSGSGSIAIPRDTYYRCIIDTSSHLNGFPYYFILPTLVFDATAFALTLFGLYKHVAQVIIVQRAAFAPFGYTSISSLMLRDGFLYFLALCTLNVAWAISSNFLDPGTQNILGFPNAALTVVLMNRMVLYTHNLAPILSNDKTAGQPFAY